MNEFLNRKKELEEIEKRKNYLIMERRELAIPLLNQLLSVLDTFELQIDQCNNKKHKVFESCNHTFDNGTTSVVKKDDSNLSIKENKIIIYGVCCLCNRKAILSSLIMDDINIVKIIERYLNETHSFYGGIKTDSINTEYKYLINNIKEYINKDFKKIENNNDEKNTKCAINGVYNNNTGYTE